MKTVSSTTASSANAVCRSAGRSCSTWLQRARTQVPIVGSPAPATAASGHTTHGDQPAVTEATSRPVAPAYTSTRGSSTRDWPSRSSSRPCRIEKAALATT